MKVSESVFSARIPFRLPAAGAGHIERSVHAFLVSGKELCLVDAGVSGSENRVLGMAREAGRNPGEVSMLILSHSHPDHIGGAPAVRRATGCLVAAHAAERAWIEDPGLQARERPVPGFTGIVEGPVMLDRLLADGDLIGIGGERSLTVLHTPGHSPGSISLFLADEGVLITGDAVPVKGEIPVYDDPAASLKSIARLAELPRVKVLLSSWDSPKTGTEITGALASGREVILALHAAVTEVYEENPDPAGIAHGVLERLGLPEAVLPVLSRTVAGHVRALERGDRMPGPG
ncbi:MAG TPA: MBL fold metallo-hydrolase [Methanomicrobiales archaeon]|nr:MBL fold metallo-hydrolase [Methanomicrobiales archaeon]